MTSCRVHRHRYRRLWRLPTVATIGTTAVVTAVIGAVSALIGPLWMPLVVFAVGVAGGTGYVRRHQARIGLEVKLVRALRLSGGRCPGDVAVSGLTAEVCAEAGPDGVTQIEARSWPDVVRGLGYVMGRDRAFHLDLLRRTARGRLAEVWGRTALPVDELYRRLGLAQAADRAAAALEPPERDLLTAFAAGVNASFTHDGPPFESRFLSYRPEPWTIEDSVVIALYLFHALSWNEPSKRAEAVIRRTLPAALATFVLPGDPDAEPGLPSGLANFRASDATGADMADIVAVDRAIAGSNCWVRGGLDGASPVLACDLHLPLTMPNLLYEVDLRWAGERVRGLAAPGLPVVLTGGNGHIVWGMTNLSADVLDLIPLDSDRAARLTTDTERIRVRGRPDTLIEVTRDETMPVFPGPGPDERVAIRWTGHDPRSCDLKFQRLAHASSVEESIKLLDEAQGIALNVLIADESGRMAHLATGLLPRRPADQAETPDECRVADGFLDGAQRPRLIDPASAILVSTNDAALGNHPFRIGYDLDPGYRTRRVRAVLSALAEAKGISPASMRDLQHDSAADLYLAYRDLAVSALAGHDDATAALLSSWDGRASIDSRVFGVLVRLRHILAQRVLSPYLAVCREHDPTFQFPFRSVDRPLLAILRSGDPTLLPAGLVAACLDEAIADLSGSTGATGLPLWGRLNSVGLNHPVESLAPWAGSLLGVAATAQSGALHSVRTCVPGFAAVGRAVLTPGAEGVAEFELPGGQSGHPLSRHYTDRHRAWSNPARRIERRQRATCAFVLRPERSEADQ